MRSAPFSAAGQSTYTDWIGRRFRRPLIGSVRDLLIWPPERSHGEAGGSSGLQEIELELIDAQLHDPVPWLDWRSQPIELERGLAIELTLAYLDATGVDRALLFVSEELGTVAAQQFPTRLAYVESVTPDLPNVENLIASASAKRRECRHDS